MRRIVLYVAGSLSMSLSGIVSILVLDEEARACVTQQTLQSEGFRSLSPTLYRFLADSHMEHPLEMEQKMEQIAEVIPRT